MLLLSIAAAAFWGGVLVRAVPAPQPVAARLVVPFTMASQVAATPVATATPAPAPPTSVPSPVPSPSLTPAGVDSTGRGASGSGSGGAPDTGLNGPNTLTGYGIDVTVVNYPDCSGKSEVPHGVAAIDTCVSWGRYFVGHNPGVFTPLVGMPDGTVLTYHDGADLATRYVIEGSLESSAGDPVPPPPAGATAQFQTCLTPSGSVIRIWWADTVGAPVTATPTASPSTSTPAPPATPSPTPAPVAAPSPSASPSARPSPSPSPG